MRSKENSVWLHIGSSPTVTTTLPVALREWDFDTVMTCNSGIKLYPVPDVYVAIDGVASREFADKARHAQENGCKLVTLKRDERAMRDRGVSHYDEHLEIPSRGYEFNGRNFTAFRFSGTFCLQYAILNGATTVVLVGCDGWRHHADYFDAADGHRVRCLSDVYHRSTMGILAPAWRNVAEACPHVRFVQYGDPSFDVGSPNWEVRPYSELAGLDARNQDWAI